MLRHDRIPVWLHRKRVRFLRGFLADLEAYYASVGFQAFPFRVVETPAAAELRARLEPRLLRCRRTVAAAGASSLLRLAPGEAAGTMERVNVIDAAFQLDRYNLGKDEVLDAIRQALSVYEADGTRAWVRTLNPFYWLDLGLHFVEQLPFQPLRILGVRPAAAARTPTGFALRVAVRLAALVGLAWLVVVGLGWQGEVSAWFDAVLEGALAAAGR